MLKRSTPLKRFASLKRGGPLRRVSKKRARQNRIYDKKRVAFLAMHPICQVWLQEHGWLEKVPFFHQRDTVWFRANESGSKIQASKDELIARYNAPLSTEIHHVNKRRGEMLNDERYWLAVCRENHDKIEGNKRWARERGYLTDF